MPKATGFPAKAKSPEQTTSGSFDADFFAIGIYDFYRPRWSFLIALLRLRNNMAHIVVDDAQAKLISESSERIEIRDQHGNHLGYVFADFTPADIQVAKQRRNSNEP